MSSAFRIELPCENRALILESDGFQRQVLHSLIEPYGLVMTECGGGEELLNKASSLWHPFVFISASEATTSFDGELIKELRSIPAYGDSVVVMVGADGSTELVVEAIQGGIDLFLSKPVDADSLLVLMATANRLLRERLHRSKVEGRLKDREKNYSEMLSILPDIIYQIDLDGRFIFVNNAVAQLGYEPHELLGQNYGILFEEDEYKRICRDYVLEEISVQGFFPNTQPKLFDERRTGQRRTEHLEVRLRHKDGEIMSKAVSSFGDICSQGYFDENVHRQGAQVTGTIGVIHDITKYKVLEGKLDVVLTDLEGKSRKIVELEHRFAEDRNLLQKQNQMFERFAYRVAHDLRSPLSFLRSLVDLYRGKELERNDFISRLEKGLSNAVSLVNGLYNLGRMHRREHSWGILSLDDVVSENCEWLSLEINARGVDIQTRNLVKVQAIEDILPLVFLNLMSNAIKYNHTEIPKILIWCEPIDDEQVKVWVEDNGAGIPVASQKIIFEAFEKLDDQRVKEGLGVGLNTVRSAIELHDSKIDVGTSQELGGASFSFVLKRAGAPAGNGEFI